jgi:hypothetical protein
MDKSAAFTAGWMNKVAWFGTYYHGTSPEAQKKILREGLRADMGGAAHGATAKLMASGTPQAKGLLEKAVKGKVTMSKSRLLAKAYGMVGDPKPVRTARESLAKSKPGAIRGLLKDYVRSFVHNRPVQIRGKGIKLTTDPFMPGVAVQSAKNIPAHRLFTSKPTRLGNLVRKVIK